MITKKFRDKLTYIELSGERNNHDADQKRKSDEQTLKFLQDTLKSGEFTDKEDIAFLLWGISDKYALLRSSEKLYENHLRFSEHLKAMSAPYLFWCVCDASQKFTLQLGGYNNFWYNLYKTACKHNQIITEENECIAYEAHRAALSKIKQLECGNDNLNYARIEFEKFLKQTRASKQYDFYRLIYKTAMIRVFGLFYSDIITDCRKFYSSLNVPEEKSEYCFGEWKKLNGFRSERNRSTVAITTAINAMIDSGYNISKIESFYNEATQIGLPRNTYIEKRIKNPRR